MLRVVLLLCSVLLAGPALAAIDIPCHPAEDAAVTIDGLLPDWRDVKGVTLDEPAQVIVGRENWRGVKDLSVTVTCLRSDANLYLAFDVTDNYLVRMREAKPGEDHIQIHFADGDNVQKLVIYPSDMKGVPRKVTGHTRMAKSAEVAEALQPRGYSVEVRIPLQAIPGYSARAVAWRGAIAVADCDSKVHGKTEKIMSTADGLARAAQLGRFTFGETVDALGHFLKQMGLTPRDVKFDRAVEMGGDPGLERVVLAGAYVAVMGEEYHYVKLNVKSVSDISDFQVLNLTGDGKHSIVVKTIERAGGGARQVLHVFKLVGAGIQRPFAMEIAKQQGPNKLVSRVSYVRHKRKTDIVVEAGRPEGWNAQNYREAPADDVVPILLPWGDKTKARFRFTGDEYEEIK
ncbi:MAG: hypothetical protein HY906_16785 [Deltaproteobacteria bacterium]|nr:hypothetical protein [Deltaproteobacteria bacterium]